jgi:hypothetical protein
LGNRIIEVPEDEEIVLYRDPSAGFVAYTISISPTGATPPRRSLRFWRNYGPTLICKQGE